jgi:hypothetical protein
MTSAEAKMTEEICAIRAALRSVSDRLDAVLEDGFPAKGRGQDAKESSELWWEDNHAAVKKARAILQDTAEYDGVIVR